MQTNDKSHENNNKRSFILITLAGIAVAGALGAAFMLGGRTDDSTASSGSEQSAVAPPASPSGEQSHPSANPAGQSDVEQNGKEFDQPSGGSEDEAAPVPTDTPTATATPNGKCAFCLDGDLGAEPTPTSTPDPCPLCNDLDLVAPVDTPPSISNISTSFCYPTMAVFFDVSDADVVWFTFVSDGVTQHSDHIDADTFAGFLTKDMGYLSWDVYFIHSLTVSAKDDQGNQVVSEDIPVPEPDLAC